MVVNDKIGLVLSGGGFKALAQLGVLHYMFELKMPIHAIAGTSAGALIGAFLAQGFTPYQLLEICKEERILSYSLGSLKHGGLFSGHILGDLVRKHIPHNSFEGLKMDLFVHVTDLTNGRELIYNQGQLSLPIQASCSFPLVFQPVQYGDLLLCDGGLMNNFPVDSLVSNCHAIIGINVNPINKITDKMNYRQLVTRIIRISSSILPPDSKNACSLYIEPDGIEHFKMFEISRIEEMFELGYTCAKQHKDALLQIVESSKSIKRNLFK